MIGSKKLRFQFAAQFLQGPVHLDADVRGRQPERRRDFDVGRTEKKLQRDQLLRIIGLFPDRLG
jgi:hypothetical protein